jgi:mono/diheme cytochrome c family protein
VNNRFSLAIAGSICVAALLTACGGGGGGGTNPRATRTPDTITLATPNRFLLFPNPQVLSDGTFEMDTTAYATAYYAAIDPTNDRDTLPKFMAINGFGSGTGTEVSATFGDVKDLGYGRRMTARQKPDGTVVFVVHNYAVNAGEGYTYTPLNLQAALAPDPSWHIGTNAIEFGPGPNGGTSFARWYTFDPTPPYARRLVANLDNRGNKAMPGICINCHGARGDALTPAAGSPTGLPLFNLVQNSLSGHRGDFQGRLHMLQLDVLDFSPTSPNTRAELEANLKTMNKFILCTYPLVGAAAGPEDACRPAAAANEWQGAAADVLKAAYGGNGLPNATFSDTFVPTGWVTAGQTTLYNTVVKDVCMTCHLLRGTANQDDIGFFTYAKFQGYADRIKTHVFDRGNMPLAKIVADRLWSTGAAETLGTWLEGQGYTVRDATGALLRPGRPIADPGPNRVATSPVTLSAAMSLYADSYSWTITSNPGGAVLTNPTSITPTLTGPNGTYVVQLTVGQGSTQSTAVSQTVVINNALAPAPAAIRFSDIKTALQAGGGTCLTCHHNTAVPMGTAGRPPVFYNDYDRNGDGLVNATDTAWLYKEVRSRINFTDWYGSPLLRKPSGNHHNGGLRTGFDTSLTPGAAGRVDYDLFLNWIINGAPE